MVMDIMDVMVMDTMDVLGQLMYVINAHTDWCDGERQTTRSVRNAFPFLLAFGFEFTFSSSSSFSLMTAFHYSSPCLDHSLLQSFNKHYLPSSTTIIRHTGTLSNRNFEIRQYMYNMADRQSAVDAFFSLIDFVLEPLVETAAHLSSYIPPHLLNPSYLSTDHSGLQEGWGPVFSRGGSDLIEKWKEVEDMGEAITTGWTALIIIITLALVIFYTRRNETGQTPANNSATFVKTNNGSVETDISTLLGYEVGSESSSASTSRSNSGSTPSLRATAAASSSQLPTNGQPNANDSQSYNRTPLTEAAHASNTPSHLVLIEYIHPKLS